MGFNLYIFQWSFKYFLQKKAMSIVFCPLPVVGGPDARLMICSQQGMFSEFVFYESKNFHCSKKCDNRLFTEESVFYYI